MYPFGYVCIAPIAMLHVTKYIILCCWHWLQIWDVDTGEALANFRGHQGRLLSMAWSHLDPDILFTGGEDFCVMKWKISECTHKQPPKGKFEAPSRTEHNRDLLLKTRSNVVQLWGVPPIKAWPQEISLPFPNLFLIFSSSFPLFIYTINCLSKVNILHKFSRLLNKHPCYSLGV